MTKFYERLFRRPILMLLPALVFTLLFNSSLLVKAPFLSKDFFVINVLGMFLATGFTWALFIIIRTGRAVFAVIMPLLFLISAVGSYYTFILSLDIDGELIQKLLNATPVDIRDYVSWKLLAWVIVSVSIGMIVTWFCLRHEKKDAREPMILLMAGAFVVSACFNDGGVSRQYFPYNFLHAGVEYALLPERPAPVDISLEPFTLAPDVPQNMAVIVIVTNGVRSDHLHFNEYPPQTTPYLGGRMNIVSYRNAMVCGPFSDYTLPCLLGRTSYLMPEDAAKENTMISVFRRNGFATAWFDAKGGALNEVAKEAEHHVLLNTSLFEKYQTDAALLPEMEKFLKENPGRVMAVVRLTGSSWPFLQRTPKRFQQQFEPLCDKPEGCDPRSLTNAYDSSIAYTDYVVDRLIKTLGEERAALVLFTSTTGQALGEDGYILHGHSKLHGEGGWMEKRAPIVMWASDPYVIQYTKRISKAFSHQSETLSHDSIFHTVLDCVGFEGPSINKALSLCR